MYTMWVILPAPVPSSDRRAVPLCMYGIDDDEQPGRPQQTRASAAALENMKRVMRRWFESRASKPYS